MIVFIHGFTGSPRSFETLERLLERDPLPHRIFAPALLGHGARAPFVDGFEEEVDRLAGLVRARRESSPVLLVGYSLGGRLALGMMTRHPDLAAAAVVVGGHPGLRDPEARAARLRADEALAQRIESSGIRRFVAEWEDMPLFASQRAVSGTVLAAQRATRLSHDPKGLARSLRTVGLGRMPDLRSALTDTSARIHMVTGGLDDRFTALAAELRPAAHTVVAGVGHNVLLEAPERLAEIVREEARALPAAPRRPELRA
jgi:2-succinyl-6-hydroxy-2,4-cyclohexadiene-1-carboxylate synthase